MRSTIYTYPILIKEAYLDTFGHVNNAMYLTILEEARWDLITQNGYGLSKIRTTGLGPTILEIKLRFLRELRLRDQVVVETQLTSYEKKIGMLTQKILRDDELCCTAELTIGLFSLAERKLILPTDDWLKAIGVLTSP